MMRVRNNFCKVQSQYLRNLIIAITTARKFHHLHLLSIKTSIIITLFQMNGRLHMASKMSFPLYLLLDVRLFQLFFAARRTPKFHSARIKSSSSAKFLTDQPPTSAFWIIKQQSKWSIPFRLEKLFSRFLNNGNTFLPQRQLRPITITTRTTAK